ncbi:MAG: hypothetical protein ACI9WS_000211 [Paraglaciecola psychrophila]|jgi:hypothetical protein
MITAPQSSIEKGIGACPGAKCEWQGQGQGLPTDSLSSNLGLALLDTEYRNFVLLRAGGFGNTISVSPEVTFNGVIQYDIFSITITS